MATHPAHAGPRVFPPAGPGQRLLRCSSMKSTFARTVLSIWSWVALGVIVLVWTPMVAIVRLVTMPFDHGAYSAGYLFRKLTVVHERLTPLWKFRTSGTLPDDMRRPYVVVSKNEILRIPLVGWMMRLARDIPLERGDAESTAKALEASSERLNSKVSVMIFPEGTRSKTGALREFKSGAFRLAIEHQAPILPLAVHGTRDALRKHDWRLGYAEAEVRVLDPVPTEGLTMDDMPALRTKVRDIISTARDDLRREFGD